MRNLLTEFKYLSQLKLQLSKLSVINSHAYLLCNQSRHAFRFVCTKRAHDNNCRISNLVCILGACDLTRKVLFCTISEWNKSEFIRKQLRRLRVYNMAPNVGLEITTWRKDVRRRSTTTKSNSRGQQRSHNKAHRRSWYNLGKCDLRIGYQNEKQVNENRRNVKGIIETGLRSRRKNRIRL